MPPISGPGPLSPIDFRQAALLGLALSVVAYIAGAQLAWQLLRRRGPRALQPAWLVQAARFTYYVLLPYGLLLRGVGLLAAALGLLGTQPLTESLLGWSNGWLEALLWAAGGGSLAWLALAWSARAAGPEAVVAVPRGWALLREVTFQQAHWAFYRAALAVWLGAYGALFVSLFLLALEAAADPRTWRDLRDPAGASALIVTAAMAWLSAGLFLFTGNLWITAATHFAVLLVFPRRAPAFAK